MNSELLAAIQDNAYWLGKFTRREYFTTFKQYTERFAPVYLTAVREAGENQESLAKELVDALAAGWAALRPWNRGTAKFNDKQMLVSYLSPMLLGLEDPGCEQFARTLQAEWGARWPKDGYTISSYKEIREGFRNMIFGIEMKDNLLALEEKQAEAEKKKK